jgi:hypothetical protein
MLRHSVNRIDIASPGFPDAYMLFCYFFFSFLA